MSGGDTPGVVALVADLGAMGQIARLAPLRTSTPKTLAEALVDEIERVAILRERHRVLGELVDNAASFAPALALMTFAIDAAKRAIGTGDLVVQIATYRELRGFDDE